MGETWHDRCQAFHLRVSTSSYINLFKWILYFTMHIQGLGFKKRWIQHHIHCEEQGNFAPLLLTFHLRVSTSSYKFLQVLGSIRSSRLYILPLVFDFWIIGVVQEFLQVLTSSCIYSLAQLWLLTLVLFKNLVLIPFYLCSCVKAFTSSCVDHQSKSHCWFVKFYKFYYHET